MAFERVWRYNLGHWRSIPDFRKFHWRRVTSPEDMVSSLSWGLSLV